MLKITMIFSIFFYYPLKSLSANRIDKESENVTAI